MNETFIECTVDDCGFTTRPSYSLAVSMENINDHLIEEHNTTFKEEWNTRSEEIKEALHKQIDDDELASRIFEAFDAYAEDS